MSFKRLPDGRIEITDTQHGVCVLTEAKYIIGLITDNNQYNDNGGPTTKVVFSTKCDLHALYAPHDSPGEVDKDRALYMFIREDVQSARISLRKAMGMTEEEISEDLGLELLAEVP